MSIPTIGTGLETGIDPITFPAFTIQSNPGAYAILLGAGISKASGLPTAWDVQTDLVSQVASLHDVGPLEANEWFEKSIGRPTNYDELIELLAIKQTERQGILRKYFEMKENAEIDNFGPTKGHRAIAELVKAGKIRIILTTNFDRLMEDALTELGIEHVVIRKANDLDSLPPLYSINCLVVHLHGDFYTPVSMLNTYSELAEYPIQISNLLENILRDYGLLIIGWSANWDAALKDAISRTTCKHFGIYWLDIADLSESAMELKSKIGATFIKESSEVALPRLLQLVESIERNEPRTPLSVSMAVSRAKKSLSKEELKIDLHDAILESIKSLQNTYVFTNSIFESNDDEEYLKRLESTEVAIAVPTALIATTAYWGNAETDHWWFDEVSRFAKYKAVSGTSDLINLLRLPATIFLYASGIAAVSSQRTELIRRLLIEPVTQDNYEKTVSVISELPLEVVLPIKGARARLYAQLKGIFVNHIGLTDKGFRDAWEEFEILICVNRLYENLVSTGSLIALVQNSERIEGWSRAKNSISDSETRANAIRELTQSRKEREDLFATLMGSLGWPTPYVQISRSRGSSELPAGINLLRKIVLEGSNSKYVQGGFCDGNYHALVATLGLLIHILTSNASGVSSVSIADETGLVRDIYWLSDPNSLNDLD